MRGLSWLPLLFFLVLVGTAAACLRPALHAALIKLKLDPSTALLVVIGMFLDNPINISVKRMSREESVLADPLAVFGLQGWWPSLQRVRRETIIAVNVGGCLIPVALAIYEAAHLAVAGRQALLGLVVAVVINTGVCYWMAKPVEGVGIAMPGLFPAIVASISALLLVPDQAPPVAFVAGVLGPLIGADLLHLRDIEKIATGIASIGGAGTFDGIILSGIMAAYLA
jgi:Predicted membrane protein